MHHFPDAGKEMSMSMNAFVWSQLYASAEVYKEPIEKVSCDMEKVSLASDCVLKTKKKACMIADSHSYAYTFIKGLVPNGMSVDVYNIDFHHDTFETGAKDEVNCGNWLRRLHEDGTVKNIYWSGHEDSNLDDKLSCVSPMAIKDVCAKDFQYVFLCRSSWWSPPHLDKVFISNFVKPIVSGIIGKNVFYEKEIDRSRYDEAFIQMKKDSMGIIKDVARINSERKANNPTA